MYSGTTLTKVSGRLMGAHQKIDRVARNDLHELGIDRTHFPSIKEILRFEGVNGPDGIKRKSPSHNEPWHFIDPGDLSDLRLLELISLHYTELVTALRLANRERAAFEAAWLAHALVDGLTPAHQYPYEEKLVELRCGEGIETRTSFKTKVLMPGKTIMEQCRNNWKMWGPRGLILTHGLFEVGIATLIAPLRLKRAMPSPLNLVKVQQTSLPELFLERARQVKGLGLFDLYYERGWTAELAQAVRTTLAPLIVETVTLAWYAAAYEADLIQ